MKARFWAVAGVVCLAVSVGCVNGECQIGGSVLNKIGKLSKKKDSVKPPANPTPSTPENSSSNGANPAPPSDSSAKPADNSTATATPGTTTPATPTDANGQPQMTAVKVDFVPGEKTIFYDDFSDMGLDEPPPHWKVRGQAVELRLGTGVRDMWFPKGSELTSGKVQLPRNFTFEYTISPDPCYQCNLKFKLRDAKDDTLLETSASGGGGYGTLDVHLWATDTIGSANPKVDLKRPITVAIWMQEGRVREYVNGERVLDANQIALKGDVDHVFVEANGPIGLRKIRFAESAPDFSTALASSGRYITHGLYFDTDSDRLKPESAPVIKAVASALLKNPTLKLEIDGFTDGTGDASHNMDLSKRRAEAVRTVLVSQFSIEAARLSSNGFGPGKPIASNDTPDGRAQNRRVEFVKQ